MNRKKFSIKANPIHIRQVMTKRRGGKSKDGAPFFPGAGHGLSIDEIRELISQQPRCSGFTFNVAPGSQTIPNIKLVGDVRLLLGIWFTEITAQNDEFTFSVNSAKICDNGIVSAHWFQNGAYPATGFPYVPYNMPLTGQDNFELVYNSKNGAGGEVQFSMWYI